MKEFTITALVREYGYDELDSLDYELTQAARRATLNAYAPYSGFKVGAAILLDNGKIATGSNQENAAYPSGLCAERTAAFHAASANPGMAFKKIAIAAWQQPAAGKESGDDSEEKKWEDGFVKEPVSPCGGCRQALAEYEHLYGNIEVILCGRDKVHVLPSIESLLPFSFVDF